MSTVHSPRRTRARTETPPADDMRPATETTSLGAILEEMRRMREEQARRETELTARLQQFEDELTRLQGNNQLSPSISRVGNSRGENAAEINIRAELGFKLKPDVFDGTVPLREFFSQFNFIAQANKWDDATKTVALAACLRGKARSVLEAVQDVSSLEFSELKSKLELRFGEGHLSQNFYTQFTNRKQKAGEDLATLGSELERLVRLAYPECPLEVRERIACAQFISAVSDNFIRKTLQLENVDSLNSAIERAKTLKIIQGEGFGKRGENFNKGFSITAERDAQERRKDRSSFKRDFKKKWRNGKFDAGRKECWTCGKTGHFRSDCPSKQENAI